MTKGILVSLAVLSLSASAALAAHPTHHRHVMNAHASIGAAPPPVGWTGGVSNTDHTTYMKNLHDSGYNPKNDFDANGVIKTQ